MKLKVPDKVVDILGTRIKIRYVKGLAANRSNLAETSFYHAIIDIDPDMALPLQFEGFVHECVEVWNNKMEWNLSHQMITQLETCIVQLLIDNMKRMVE